MADPYANIDQVRLGLDAAPAGRLGQGTCNVCTVNAVADVVMFAPLGKAQVFTL